MNMTVGLFSAGFVASFFSPTIPPASASPGPTHHVSTTFFLGGGSPFKIGGKNIYIWTSQIS